MPAWDPSSLQWRAYSCMILWFRILSDSNGTTRFYSGLSARLITNPWKRRSEPSWKASLGEKAATAEEPSRARGRDPESYAAKIPAVDATAVDATMCYCDYVFKRYGRFPAYSAPFRTVIGFQVCHVDVDFYDLFYSSESIPDTVRTCTNSALRHP